MQHGSVDGIWQIVVIVVTSVCNILVGVSLLLVKRHLSHQVARQKRHEENTHAALRRRAHAASTGEESDHEESGEATSGGHGNSGGLH